MESETIFSAFQSIFNLLSSIAFCIAPQPVPPATAPDPVAAILPPGLPTTAHPFAALASVTAPTMVLQSEASLLWPAYEDTGSLAYLDPFRILDPHQFPDPRQLLDLCSGSM